MAAAAKFPAKTMPMTVSVSMSGTPLPSLTVRPLLLHYCFCHRVPAAHSMVR